MFNMLYTQSYRIEQDGSLTVDGGVVATGTSPGPLNQLNINNGLYLGKIIA